MVLLTLNVSPKFVKNIDDYATIIRKVIDLDIAFNIISFSTSSKAVNLIIDVPKDKIEPLTKALKDYNILIQPREPISIDMDLCIYCGQCISLCSTDALHFDEDYKLIYDSEMCVGCLLCVDSCVRSAINENL